MLDDLRNSALESYKQEEPEEQPEDTRRRIRLNARQRFLVSLGLLLLVLVVSTVILVSTGRMVL